MAELLDRGQTHGKIGVAESGTELRDGPARGRLRLGGAGPPLVGAPFAARALTRDASNGEKDAKSGRM
jgi:hypothetical protein